MSAVIEFVSVLLILYIAGAFHLHARRVATQMTRWRAANALLRKTLDVQEITLADLERRVVSLEKIRAAADGPAAVPEDSPPTKGVL